MNLGDYAKAILRGGLPAILDSPAASPTAQGDTRPEQTPPAGTNRDVDSAVSAAKASDVTIFTPKNIAIGVGGLIVLGLVVWAVSRHR